MENGLWAQNEITFLNSVSPGHKSYKCMVPAPSRSSTEAEFHRSLQHPISNMIVSHQRAGRQDAARTGNGQKSHIPPTDEPQKHHPLSEPSSWQAGNRCLVRICWRLMRIFCLSSWISLSLSSSSSSSCRFIMLHFISSMAAISDSEMLKWAFSCEAKAKAFKAVPQGN